MKKIFLIILSLNFLAMLFHPDLLRANPRGVGSDENGRLPSCLSCHQQVKKENVKYTFDVIFNKEHLKGGDELEIKVISNAGDNSVRGVFLTTLNKNRVFDVKQGMSLSEMENPANEGFVFSDKPFDNYKEQYYMYKNKAVDYTLRLPNPETDREYTFYTVLAYGEDYNDESIHNKSNAKYIISEALKLNVSHNPDMSVFNKNSFIEDSLEDTLNNEGIEKIKISFYDVEQITGIININIIAFILLTMAILLFISERYYKRTIKEFYKDRETLSPSSTGVFVFYDLLRKLLLYVSLILISVTLIQKRVWVVSFDNYIDIFSFPMLIGFIFLIVGVVIDFIKLIDDKLRVILFYVFIGLGYIIYEIGFLLGVNLL